MRLHHVELNARDLDASYPFYKRLFKALGCERSERTSSSFVFYLDGFYLWVNRCSPAKAEAGFDRYRIGLNHLAFQATSKALVDDWHSVLLSEGVKVLDPPGYYGPGYYAVYFEDPDGMKLELGFEEGVVAEAQPTSDGDPHTSQD